MLRDGDNLFFGKAGIKKDDATPFGKGFFSVQAVGQASDPDTILGSILGADADIATPTETVLGTMFSLTAKDFQVVHDSIRKTKRLKKQRVRGNAQAYKFPERAAILIDHKIFPQNRVNHFRLDSRRSLSSLLIGDGNDGLWNRYYSFSLSCS
jgi:hypothetical protein